MEAVAVGHGSVCAVWDDELSVDARDEPEGHEEEVEGEVEDVESRAGEVPGNWCIQGSGRDESDARTVDGSHGEDGGGGEDDEHLSMQGALAEVVDGLWLEGWVRLRDAGDSHDGDRQQGCDGEDDVAEELDPLRGGLGESVGEVGLDDDTDDEEEDGDAADQSPDSDGQGNGLPPPEMWVLAADESLGEEEVGEDEDDDAGVDENLGGRGETGVGRADSPGHSERCGYDSSTAEGLGSLLVLEVCTWLISSSSLLRTRCEGVEDESSTSPPVEVVESDVCHRCHKEQGEERRVDWDIGYDGRDLSQSLFLRQSSTPLRLM